jgi:hypothetical protein
VKPKRAKVTRDTAAVTKAEPAPVAAEPAAAAATTTQASVPKKRGRPSKAELALKAEHPAAGSVGAAATVDIKPEIKPKVAAKPPQSSEKKRRGTKAEATKREPPIASPIAKGAKKHKAAPSPGPGMSSVYPTSSRPSPEVSPLLPVPHQPQHQLSVGRCVWKVQEAHAAWNALVDMYGKPDGPTLDAQGTVLERKESRKSVLDSLVGTMLSQNTTDINSRRAFAALKVNPAVHAHPDPVLSHPDSMCCSPGGGTTAHCVLTPHNKPVPTTPKGPAETLVPNPTPRL